MKPSWWRIYSNSYGYEDKSFKRDRRRVFEKEARALTSYIMSILQIECTECGCVEEPKDTCDCECHLDKDEDG